MQMQRSMCQIKAKYIVLKIKRVKQTIRSQGGKIGHEYSTTFQGFQATIPKGTVSTLQSHEHVDNIEEDSKVQTQ